MTIVTINDKEYDTEKLTDKQQLLVHEIRFNDNLQTQLNYQSSSLSHTLKILTDKLEKITKK